MIVVTEQLLEMAEPLNMCTTIEQRGIVRFCGLKIWEQRISKKKCCPCTVNIASDVRQSIIGCSINVTLLKSMCFVQSPVKMYTSFFFAAETVTGLM